MDCPEWVREFPGAVTICDVDGVILYMNDRSAALFMKSGGAKLIGRNLFDCHPEPYRTTLKELLETQRINTYSVEEKGTKRFFYEAPWYKDGKYCGFVELSFEVPMDIHNIKR